MDTNDIDIGKQMKMEEELDFADPLRHLRKTDESQSEILPSQPVSVQNQIVQLSFTCGSPEEQIQILLKVDASPGCGGLAWPAGEVRL